MRIRPGLCQNCGARYQIPASYTHDRARCRQCGGEVLVEAAREEPDAPASAAVAPAAPQSVRAATPPVAAPPAAPARRAATDDAELEVLEVLDALEEQPAPPPRPRAPAPNPAASPAAVPSANPKPADSDAPPIPARIPPARQPSDPAQTPVGASGRAPKGDDGGDDGEDPEDGANRAPKPRGTLAALKARAAAERAAAERAAAKAPTAAPAKPSSSAPSQRPAAPATLAQAAQVAASRRTPAPTPAAAATSARGSKTGRGGSERGRAGREEPAGRGRGGRPQKQRNPALALVGVFGVVAAIGLAYWLFSSGLLDPAPAVATAPQAVANPAPVAPSADPFEAFRTPTEEQAATAGGVSAASAPAPETADAAAPPRSTGIVAPEGTAPGEALSDGLGATAIPSPTQSSGPSTLVAEARRTDTPASSADPASIDLSKLEDFAPLEGTSDEDWKSIQELTETLFNPMAGARGGRASRSLIEKGNAAVPALLNGLKRLDYSEMNGVVTGGLALETLQGIAGLTTAWRRRVQPEDQVFNKRTVQTWFAEWQRIHTDPALLAAFGRRTTEAPPGDGDTDG